MNRSNIPSIFRSGVRLATAILTISFILPVASTEAQSSLEIRLTPTVSVEGQIGSWQQIQFSDDIGSPTNWEPLTNLLLMQSPVLFTDTGVTGAHRFYRSEALTNVVNTNMVWIPAGTFLMGSPSNEIGRADDEGPQTQVTLTHGFFISKFEVTQQEYVSVVGSYPTLFGSAPKSNSFAISHVLWDEAVSYCDLLTQRESASFHIPPGWAYRLPTEAEWEYACRAGTTTVFAYGNALYNSTNQGSLANFDGRQPYPPTGSSDPTGIFNLLGPIAAGSYSPNGFGIYDMHGNVEEWCLDGYTNSVLPDYAGGSVTNPMGPGGPYHISRGGAFSSTGDACRSARRSASLGSPLVQGFRVVLAPANP